MEEQDLQQNLFYQIKAQLSSTSKLVDVLSDKLNISSDAAYRRISGKVPLSIFETQILLDTYDISMGRISSNKKGKITFAYRPLSRHDVDFESYITELRDQLKAIKQLKKSIFYYMCYRLTSFSSL